MFLKDQNVVPYKILIFSLWSGIWLNRRNGWEKYSNIFINVFYFQLKPILYSLTLYNIIFLSQPTLGV